MVTSWLEELASTLKYQMGTPTFIEVTAVVIRCHAARRIRGVGVEGV